MSSSNSKKDECSICLAAIDPRGGVPLSIPGCCGAQFHQPCLQDVTRTGNHTCPMCRAPLPSSLIAAPAPAITTAAPSAPSFFNTVFGQIPPAPTAPASNNYGFGGICTRSPQRRGGGRSSRTTDVLQFPDDPIVLPPAATAAAGGGGGSSTSSAASAGTNSAAASAATPVTLSLGHCNEFNPIHCEAIDKYYSSVVVKYVEQVGADGDSRAPIDCVCILDTSGSMGGTKIVELKKAMNYVVSTLNQYDRLAIVDFNSDASIIQGFSRMTESNKLTTNRNIETIQAGGGTDIYRGLHLGNDLLTHRTTKNPTSCVFLLTDGQDGNSFNEKLAIAKSLKTAGSSLFVFGFGADHDAQHLTAIANAAEGSFMYVETSDNVIDAFGGAIGSQMSGMMYNVRVTIAIPNLGGTSGNSIKKIHAGAYPVRTIVEGKTYEITFSSLFAGESRDLLLEMALPAGPASDVFQLVTTSARFEVNRTDGSATRDTIEVPHITNSVRRSADLKTLKIENRNPEMEFKIARIEATKAMEEAVLLAERGQNTEAKALMSRRCEVLRCSPVKGDVKMKALLEEVEASMHNVEREHYFSGGRANMMESCTAQNQQRQVYSKSACSPSLFQSAGSSSHQNLARASKTPKAP